MAKGRANRLGFAVLLLFYRPHGRFPAAPTEIEPQAVDQVARQIGMGATPHDGLDPAARTWKRHRAEIRALFGYHEATVAAAEALEDWLRDQAATVGTVPDHLVARLEARCRELAIEPPAADRVARIVRAAIHAHEERLYARIRYRLTPEPRARLEALLQPESDAGSGSDGDGQPGAAPALLLRLRGDPGRPSLAGAALDHPDGIVRELAFPVVGEQTLRDLVQEPEPTGPTYRITLRTVIRNSYKDHYRRTVPQILKALDFRSNNRCHRPVIQALDLLKRYADTRPHTYPADEDVPIDGVARGLWREAVIEKDAEGRSPVNRITYEICALEALRDKLRRKEVWVIGANRSRNPDDDVPADFEAQRPLRYRALNLPLEADRFIADVQVEMGQALHTLDAGLPTDAKVRQHES